MLQCMMPSTHCISHTSTYTLLQHVSAKLSIIALRLVDLPIPFPLSPFHFPPPPLLPSPPLSHPSPTLRSDMALSPLSPSSLSCYFFFCPLFTFPLPFDLSSHLSLLLTFFSSSILQYHRATVHVRWLDHAPLPPPSTGGRVGNVM